MRQGYGYRLCLLGDVTPAKVQDWQDQLRREAELIRVNAAAPRVIHGGDLLAWAERFPAIIAWLRNMTQEVLHWDAWEKNCRKVTPIYVRNPSWEGVRGRIVRHVDLSQPCSGNPCLLIGGAAGVGKTRLVFETLAESKASPSLVVYAADEREARKAAACVAINPQQTAIIVADECSLESCRNLNDMLLGHSDRIRVIGLANTVPEHVADAWLDRGSIKGTTHRIIASNFPDIPEDRRRQYADFTRGFVRFAADMCQHDSDLAIGNASGLLKSAEQYVRGRLQGDHLPLVSLLALFHKVGFQGEVRSEIEVLCGIVNRNRQEFIDAVGVVRESPGFVVQAGRYWYVTPEIVTEILFQEGWRRWVEPDLPAFFTSLPGDLRQQLIDRAGQFGGEEVRGQIASFFRGWFGRLTVKDLAEPNAASLAAAIVRSSPGEYLGKLRVLIDGSVAEDLLKINSDWNGRAWGPRQDLVWVLESLVAFPDFFDDCEACLFRLASHETGHLVTSGAAAIWQSLFSVELSGTAMPFERRIGVLRERTLSPSVDEARLAFRGLDRVFAVPSRVVAGPPEIAWRRRPDCWRPASYDEDRACYLHALKLCGEHLAGGDADRRALAFDLIVNHLDFLLGARGGFLDEIAAIVASSRLSQEEGRRLVNAVDQLLASEAPAGLLHAKERPMHWTQPVRRWVDSLRPSDFDGMLRGVCARGFWDRRFADDPRAGRNEVDELAAQIAREPSRLVPHLDWLASHEARSAEHLGFALGRVDEAEACGVSIVRHAIRTAAAPFLRGYIKGLGFAERHPNEELIQLMGDLEAAHPRHGRRYPGLRRR